MQEELSLAAYDYDLPESHIAQFPADRRDGSKLLVYNRRCGSRDHVRFTDIVEFFAPGDLLVVNNTKVFPARLFGKKESGGTVELFLLGYPVQANDRRAAPDESLFTAEVLIRSSRRPAINSRIIINQWCECFVLADLGRGSWRINLSIKAPADLTTILGNAGQVPLPPYIKRPDGPTAIDVDRYQTVYADRPGAVAAPTAGLHFTDAVLARLKDKGVRQTSITLHVGYGTFSPVQCDDIRQHRIHREFTIIPDHCAHLVETTRQAGGSIWAVGTTTVRALEHAARSTGAVQPMHGWCDLYITPGFRFQVVDRLITNFHLPRSSLLFLVAALCGREALLNCYREAIARDYRFYSYGDAMAIID